MEFNSDQLRLIRSAFRQTQVSASEQLDIPQGRYSRIESGLSTPTDVEVTKMTMTFSVKREFFFEHPSVFMVAEAQYRKRQAASIRDQRATQDMARFVAQRLKMLFEKADVTIQPRYELPTVDPNEFRSSPAEVAQQIRTMLRLGQTPIKNMFALIESFGVYIVEHDFTYDGIDTQIDGFTFNAERPVIFIASNRPLDRKRFTLAHEFGHVIMHQHGVNPTSEDEANAFASELLLPADGVREDLINPNMRHYERLKLKWRASIKALIYRTHVLGLIDDRKKQYFYKQYSAFGWSTQEPHQLSGERPSLVEDVIRFIHKENDLSISDMIQSMNATDWNHIVNAAIPFPRVKQLPSNVFTI